LNNMLRQMRSVVAAYDGVTTQRGRRAPMQLYRCLS
jgi:hypothetical protein